MFKRIRRLALVLVLGSAAAVPAVALTPGAAFASTCNQHTHVWIATNFGSFANGNTIVTGPNPQLWPVGVVEPGTQIQFSINTTFGTGLHFFDPTNGSVSSIYKTSLSQSNCVVDQPDDSAAPSVVGAGAGDIYAFYYQWENGQPVTTLVGHIVT